LAELRRGGRSAGRRDQPVAERPKLEPIERELFEILVTHPDLVPFALEAVGPNELTSETGRAIFEAYVELESSGSLLDFPYLLTRLEETHLKNILVELDELARQKAAHAQQDGRERLNDVIRYFRRREKKIEHDRQIAAIEQRLLNEQEELAILEDIIDQERDRQGISAPTDG
jgi:DNA primase